MAFRPSDELTAQLDDLAAMCEEARNKLNEINNKRNSNDIQHQVLFISLVRAIKYFDAYLQLAKSGHGEPSAALVRSIYEASLWMRWSLQSKQNAEVYFNASKGEAIRMINKLLSRHLIQITKYPDQKVASEMLNSHFKAVKLPSWVDLARQTGLEDLHALIYPMLSAMSHGSLLFMGERIMKNKTISPMSDSYNILVFVPVANNVFRDCFLLCEKWICHGRVHPITDVRNLMTQD